MDRSCSQNLRRSGAFKILTGKLTEKIHLGRPRHKWEVNIRLDLKELGVNTRNRVYLAQGRDYW